MLRIESLLDVKMVGTLLDTKEVCTREDLERKANSECGIRLLEIMAAISDGARILPFMAQLLHHPDSQVRSKAALLVGRSNKNYKCVERRMMEADPRVRANALESLWDVDSEGIRGVLWAATADRGNRVAVFRAVGKVKHSITQFSSAAQLDVNWCEKARPVQGLPIQRQHSSYRPAQREGA